MFFLKSKKMYMKCYYKALDMIFPWCDNLMLKMSLYLILHCYVWERGPLSSLKRSLTSFNAFSLLVKITEGMGGEKHTFLILAFTNCLFIMCNSKSTNILLKQFKKKATWQAFCLGFHKRGHNLFMRTLRLSCLNLLHVGLFYALQTNGRNCKYIIIIYHIFISSLTLNIFKFWVIPYRFLFFGIGDHLITLNEKPSRYSKWKAYFGLWRQSLSLYMWITKIERKKLQYKFKLATSICIWIKI